MAPGAKTPRRLHPDTRAWWIVQDGQIRFTIDGQEPFVARKGFLVQVPYRNVYSMETVGDTPSLRLEVNIGGATTMYPADEKPASLPGFNFVKVRIDGKGSYDARNKPFVDFNAVAAGTDPTRRFIADDRAVANIIRGKPPTAGAERQGALSSRVAGVLVHSRGADSLPHRLAAGLPRRPGRHRVRAQTDVASRLARSDTDVHAVGDERLPGSPCTTGSRRRSKRDASSPWCKSIVAPRAARRPDGKARRLRISGIFEGGATQPAGMHRRSNADGVAPRAARHGVDVSWG